MIGTAHRQDPFYLTTERPADAVATVGCRVSIKNIQKSLYQFTQPDTRNQLTSQFAPFLIQHTDRHLSLQNKAIRPNDAIEESHKLRPFKVTHAGERHDVSMQVFHWADGERKELYLCSQNGIPLQPINSRSLSATDNFSVFAKSALFEQLHDANLLSSVEMTADSGRKEIISAIRQRVRKYFRRRMQQESDVALERLREEGSYPYLRDPKTEVDKIERRVFDLCAVNISRHLPSFSEKMDIDGRKLLLQVVREAITQNPTSVGKIIREVCKLPENEAKSFARLLDDVPLQSVVHLSKMLAERLCFLELFESTVYLNPFEERVRERTQLQKLMEHNTWLFGEEYAIGTGDENLVEILTQHIGILDRDNPQPTTSDSEIRAMINSYNESRKKTPESLARVPDMMLWRKYVERRPDEYEFLVIEIKRPGVPIGRKEIAQIEDYANAVVSTPFADQDRTRWVFVLISDDLDEYAKGRAHQRGMPPYTIHIPDDGRYEIRAIPWNQVIRAAKARHNHLQKWLDFTATRENVAALAEEAYAEFLPKAKPKKKQPK